MPSIYGLLEDSATGLCGWGGNIDLEESVIATAYCHSADSPQASQQKAFEFDLWFETLTSL